MEVTHTWHAVDLVTGERGPQLEMQARGTVSRIIGEATDTQASVLCWDQQNGREMPGWRDWTVPGRKMAVLVDDDDLPVWGGMFLRRIPDETIWVPVTMATLEHYFDRRYIGPGYILDDEATIAEQMILNTMAADGIPFTIAATATGFSREFASDGAEDKTVMSVLTDIMKFGTMEFTVDLAWTDINHTTLEFIFRVGPRIGTTEIGGLPPGGSPQPVRFEHPGSIISFQVAEDYTKGTGANDVLALSSGEGPARPQSAYAVDLSGGWVRYERRFTPSTNITSPDVLDAYATARLTSDRTGLTQPTFVANLDTAPKLGTDWHLGDDVTVVITAPAYPEQVISAQRFPGYEKTVRIVKWAIDLDARTLTPSAREL